MTKPKATPALKLLHQFLSAAMSSGIDGAEMREAMEWVLERPNDTGNPAPKTDTYQCRAPQGYVRPQEPDSHDGHDYEGFIGGCQRMGCKASVADVVMGIPTSTSATVSDEQIKSVFLANGFTIKEGLTDLKPYVYQAARALLAAGGQVQAAKLLAADHSGMKVDYRGLFSQVQRALKRTDPGYAEMLRQLEGHLQELGQRWYAGDTDVVDEMLQLYCIECNARKTFGTSATAAAQAKQGGAA